MNNGRYVAGSFVDDIDNFYYDTRFNSYEECVDWGLNHDCDMVYDGVEDIYIYIETGEIMKF